MTKINDLLVKISKRTKDGVESWEGTATLPGLAPAKVTKLKTNESKFGTRSDLTAAAKRLANRYGFGEVRFEGVGVEKTEDKKTETHKPRTRKTTEVETVSA